MVSEGNSRGAKQERLPLWDGESQALGLKSNDLAEPQRTQRNHIRKKSQVKGALRKLSVDSNQNERK